MTDAEWDDMVLIGIVARSHGNRGEVIVNPVTDFPDERFRAGARVFLRLGNGPVREFTLSSVRFQQGRPILGLGGISSIGEAEVLATAELRIPATEQRPLPAGTYYHHQLIGCDVVTAQGEAVGRVTGVEGEGAMSRLVVKGRRGELLIPLAEEICRVDVAARQITITPPEGLLELGGDWRE